MTSDYAHINMRRIIATSLLLDCLQHLKKMSEHAQSKEKKITKFVGQYQKTLQNKAGDLICNLIVLKLFSHLFCKGEVMGSKCSNMDLFKRQKMFTEETWFAY